MIEDKDRINIKDILVPMPRPSPRSLPISIEEAALDRSGYACQFDDCAESHVAALGVARIRSISPGGRRYDPSAAEEDLARLDNLIVLCANHNRVVTEYPDQFTSQRLTEMRDRHLARIAVVSMDRPSEDGKAVLPVPRTVGLLRAALDIWESERRNPNEEFWQSFFDERPQLLLTLSPSLDCSCSSVTAS